MKVLFVHNNFPAQYLHVVRALAKDPRVQMVAIGSSTAQTMDCVQAVEIWFGKR